MIMIVLELTGSYNVALAWTVGIVTATMIRSQLFVHSIFRQATFKSWYWSFTGPYGYKTNVRKYYKDHIVERLKFKSEVIVDVAKAEMAKMQVSEAHINTHEENILANC